MHVYLLTYNKCIYNAQLDVFKCLAIDRVNLLTLTQLVSECLSCTIYFTKNLWYKTYQEKYQNEKSLLTWDMIIYYADALTLLLLAVSMPDTNTRFPNRRAMHRFK